MTMTRDQYLNLQQAMHSKAIRVAVYDAAILIGGVLLIDKVTSSDLWATRESIFSSNHFDWLAGLRVGVTLGLAFMWLGCIAQRYRDWKSIAWIEEKVIDYDPDEEDDLGRSGLRERLRRLD
jgi:hypothetical protein